VSTIDRSLKDQLQRASNSITFNIAEGSSRFSHEDRKNFFVIVRESAFECASILDLIEDSDKIDFLGIKNLREGIGKILFKMIANPENQIKAKK
jgi:four helix bundle protein